MDIVERLTVRNMPYGSLVLLDEAAKEIERLRAALKGAEIGLGAGWQRNGCRRDIDAR